ncbi:MAG: antitoxin [Deltaproteobacteria bacterium]|nr:antitoxin [Deltaproteobacteria bacterium]
MRTTLTLDPDVAAALQRLAAERNLTWKEAVNAALRDGIVSLERAAPKRKRYRTPVVDPGPPALAGVHSVHEMLAFAEGEDYR